MVSNTFKYALRIMSYMGRNPDKWLTGVEISKNTGVPLNYLQKILNTLRKKRLVISQKGWGGGFLLKKSRLKTNLYEISNILEGEKNLRLCILGFGNCEEKNPCSLHEKWSKINQFYEEMLKNYTIEDLSKTELRKIIRKVYR